MGTLNTRRAKVDWLKRAINMVFSESPECSIDKVKLLAEFALENSSTERTGAEILNLLAKTGFIKINGDEIIR